MFNIIVVVIVSFIIGIATFVNPASKAVPQKPPITIATPSSEIATSTAIPKNSVPVTPSTSNNNNDNAQLARNQTIKDCLGRVEVFRKAASKMGYPQNEIDGLMQIEEYNCNQPSNRTTTGRSGGSVGSEIDSKLNDLESKQRQSENKARESEACQKQLTEYAECNKKYVQEWEDYNKCLSRDYSGYCSKPYESCFKPVCAVGL